MTPFDQKMLHAMVMASAYVRDPRFLPGLGQQGQCPGVIAAGVIAAAVAVFYVPSAKALPVDQLTHFQNC